MHEELKQPGGEQRRSVAEAALIGKPYEGKREPIYAAIVLLLKIYFKYHARTHIKPRQLPRTMPHITQTMTYKSFLEHLLHQ